MKRAVVAVAFGLGAVLGGCALPIQQEIATASELATYARHYDHVVGPERNLLDRTLVECSEKTVKAETVCVREALAGGHLSAQGLVALIPDCRAGTICHYDHTTRDDLGFVKATATEFIVRWRLEFDLRHPAASAAAVPFTVRDRDDFDVTVPNGRAKT